MLVAIRLRHQRFNLHVLRATERSCINERIGSRNISGFVHYVVADTQPITEIYTFNVTSESTYTGRCLAGLSTVFSLDYLRVLRHVPLYPALVADFGALVQYGRGNPHSNFLARDSQLLACIRPDPCCTSLRFHRNHFLPPSLLGPSSDTSNCTVTVISRQISHTQNIPAGRQTLRS